MKTKKPGINLTRRLETGAAILAAARVVDVTLVKARLGTFANAQRSYAEAQGQVDAADTAWREGQVRLVQRDAEQNDAVEGLARALIWGGQPRGNPFGPFGTGTPSAVKELPAAAKAKTIHQLVTAVQAKKSVGKAALQAAEAAEQAAARADAALLVMDKLETSLSNARCTRDIVGQTWAKALQALKLGARSAAADGAPGLYAALFGRTNRTRKKAVTPAPPAPAPPAPAPPVATVSTT